MKLKYIYTTFTSLLLLACTILFTSYQDGPGTSGGAYIGAPGELGTTCGTCHKNPGSYGFVFIDIKMLRPNGTAVNAYIPGNSYDIVITVNSEVGTPAGYGFQAVALDNANNNAGTFASENANIDIETINNRLYAEHNTPSPTNVFTVRWQAPSASSGTVTFYASGNAVNGDGTRTGDSGLGTGPATLSIIEDVALASEILSFEAVKSLNSALLKWTTATETNSDYFVIEHSTNGIDFEKIGQLPAAGNSNELRTYTYRHTQAQEGNNYYRLNEVATDSRSTYSHIITLKINEISHGTIDVFPNPVMDKTQLYIHNHRDTDYTTQVFLYDVLGQCVRQQQSNLVPGENQIAIDMSDLESGYYFITNVNKYQHANTPINVLKK